MKLDIRDLQWTREPAAFTVSGDRTGIVTKPHTDLWQRTECKWPAHDGQPPDEE